jgi:hypothetical protein
MLLFRSEDHVNRWCAAWRQPFGALLTPEQAWQLARAWYSLDRRDPDWRRFTVEETEAWLQDLGLTESFWDLR